jgi:hypothetical protein
VAARRRVDERIVSLFCFIWRFSPLPLFRAVFPPLEQASGGHDDSPILIEKQ